MSSSMWQQTEEMAKRHAVATWGLLVKCWPALRHQIPGLSMVRLPLEQPGLAAGEVAA